MSRFVAQALAYHRLGFCIIPIKHKSAKGKEAACAWKRYQRERPSETTLKRLFTPPDLDGLAVIFGDVSGGLTARDFDVGDSYDRWKWEQPDLADMLPTMATARGYQVFFLSPIRKTFDLGDGELRAGSGSYSLLPESVHPNRKTIYAWTVPLIAGGIPTIPNPSAVGLTTAHATEATERTETTETTERTEAIGKGSISVLSVLSVTGGPGIEIRTVDDAIHLTLPLHEGQRNRCIFDFARALKFNLGMGNADVQTLRETVRLWHKAALPVIGTKPFDDTWFDFLHAWERARYPLGEGIMAEVWAKAVKGPIPQVAERYENPNVRLLVCLCREWQRAVGKGPFFLAVRTAGKLLGVNHWTAWVWLRGLERDGVLRAVERGGQGALAWKATRYRYLAD